MPKKYKDNKEKAVPDSTPVNEEDKKKQLAHNIIIKELVAYFQFLSAYTFNR